MASSAKSNTTPLPSPKNSPVLGSGMLLWSSDEEFRQNLRFFFSGRTYSGNGHHEITVLSMLIHSNPIFRPSCKRMACLPIVTMHSGSRTIFNVVWFSLTVHPTLIQNRLISRVMDHTLEIENNMSLSEKGDIGIRATITKR